jgi:hypothetical protein
VDKNKIVSCRLDGYHEKQVHTFGGIFEGNNPFWMPGFRY